MIVEAPDAQAMEALGARLAAGCMPGILIFLRGALGAGKTTLTRGFLRTLGHVGAVKSPTFTLVEPYELSDSTIYHFDFYRISDPEELEFMGIDDYFRGDAICLVEWPERAAGRLPTPTLDIAIEHESHNRRVTLNAAASGGARLLNCVSAYKNG